MSFKSVSRIGATGVRSLRSHARTLTSRTASSTLAAPAVAAGRQHNVAPTSTVRNFHASLNARAGIMPHSENPAPKESENNEQATAPTDISADEYNELADQYLDNLVSKLEAEQEKQEDFEVEYSAGVLEVSIPSKNHTYVINKQPPNKQIWLSSPITGPKRFDWVVFGESMHQKEGGGSGDWIYLRDGSSLTDIIRKELGVSVTDEDAPQ